MSHSVQLYFTRSAVSFDSLYSPAKTGRVMRFLNRRFRRDIFERFVLTVDHVRNCEARTVFDVGCGSGRYVSAFTEVGVRRYVGIDFSPAMIELARAANSGRGFGDAAAPEFVCGDVLNYRTNETFDVVVAMGVFDYVADPAALLAKLASLSRHSVVASFPSINWYRTPIRKTRYFFKRCPVYFFDRRRIEALAESASFADYRIRKIEGAGQDYFVEFFTTQREGPREDQIS